MNTFSKLYHKIQCVCLFFLFSTDIPHCIAGGKTLKVYLAHLIVFYFWARNLKGSERQSRENKVLAQHRKTILTQKLVFSKKFATVHLAEFYYVMISCSCFTEQFQNRKTRRCYVTEFIEMRIIREKGPKVVKVFGKRCVFLRRRFRKQLL